MRARNAWRTLTGALGFRGFSGTVWTITMEYLLTQLGYFIMLPILPLLLNRYRGLSMGEVGTVMLFFTVMIRGSSILVGNLADRFPIKKGMLLSLVVTAVCFALLPVIEELWSIYLVLAVTGFAISVNFTMSKALVASDVEDRADHVRAFGLINLFVNLSAAFGPVIGTWFLGREQYVPVLLLIACCYVAAFLLILLLLPGEPRHERAQGPSAGPAASPASPAARTIWSEYIELLFKDRAYRKLSLLNFMGWFLYGQLFSGIPLYVVARFELDTMMGTLFTVNAVLIVSLQMAVARATAYLQRERGFSLERLLLCSYLFFAGSFFIVGMSGQWLVLLYVSVAVFTMGEMLFTPMSSTIASSMMKPGKRVLYFNTLNISQALGEGLGMYIGVAVLHLFIASGQASLYWHLLGACGMLGALLVHLLALSPAPEAGAAGAAETDTNTPATRAPDTGASQSP